jgi:hypothetical protein
VSLTRELRELACSQGRKYQPVPDQDELSTGCRTRNVDHHVIPTPARFPPFYSRSVGVVAAAAMGCEVFLIG